MASCEVYTGPANKHGDRPVCGLPATWLVTIGGIPAMYLCDEHAKSPDREPGELHRLSENEGEGK